MSSKSSSSSAIPLKQELKNLEEKQIRLLDAYLDQTITNEEYTETKRKILNRKIEIKENLKESGGRGLLIPSHFGRLESNNLLIRKGEV